MRINWAAILVAGVADWVLGGVWFTVFANQWRGGLRMTPDELQRYMSHPNFWPYLVALLCNLLMGYIIARIVVGYPTHSLFRGIYAGLLVGFAAAFAMVTEMVFEIRPGSFILISSAYPVLGCILMGIIIGVWKPKTKSI
ncbi:MAG TPA: DUF1761 domain-containing protein [Terriglobales bacterium]|jgi:hypothetical protein|nr:DUF1761 domain-containing protein [Terriglobales bacterium]